MKPTGVLKKSQLHEEVEAETWALSYGDMITLLLSFFVIYFTTDPVQTKVNKLNQHMSFSIEGVLTSPNTANPLGKNSIESAELKTVKLPEAVLTNVKAVAVGEMVVISFGATSFFESGSTKLHAGGVSILKQFTEKYLPFAGNYQLSVKGFTDKTPVQKAYGKKYEDNLELSALRSIAAMRVLQNSGIPLNRMDIAGAGELNAIDKILPDAAGMTEEQINAVSRTIVIVVKPEKESWL